MKALIGLWLGGVVAGFAVWESYEATPGNSGSGGDAQSAAQEVPSLVVYLHPYCPCSRATLAELGGLLRANPAGGETGIVFVCPDGVPADLEKAELWKTAVALPGSHVRADSGGVEARRAGAETSGDVIARTAAGKVAFRGGITRARGQYGDNPGRQAVVDVLAGVTPASERTPVFGCPLFDE